MPTSSSPATLTAGGIYETQTGGILDLNIGGPLVTDAAHIVFDTPTTTNGYSSNPTYAQEGAINSLVMGIYTPIQTTLQTIATSGILELDSQTSYNTLNNLTVAGTVLLNGTATLSAGPLQVASGGLVTGTGTITGPIVDNGTISVTDLDAFILTSPLSNSSYPGLSVARVHS